MSAEEKRQTILGVYHKMKQVYTEKEILALASKAGVNANTQVHRSRVSYRAINESCAYRRGITLTYTHSFILSVSELRM